MAKTKSGVTPTTQSGVDPKSIPCKLGNVPIEFDKIQGNIFGGFSKDHHVTILLEITDAAKARAALRPMTMKEGVPKDVDDSIYNHVVHSDSRAVIAFNEQFRALHRDGIPEGTIIATWTNLVFTARGMQQLGLEMNAFPEAFKGGDSGNGFLGMVGRASEIGDQGDNAPAYWDKDMDVHVNKWESVGAAILVSSDDPSQLVDQPQSRVGRYLATLRSKDSGLVILGIIVGETRVDDVGHEHFGFKDGVSQPGIRGVDAPDDALHNPDQGNPGQDLLHPGEFVLGYPRQIPAPEDAGPGGPNRCQGIIAGETFYTTDPEGSKTVLPPWALNGSFLVFRRLAQDVKGFRDSIDVNAALLGLTPELLGAKLVGRYKSGAPLEALRNQAGIGEYHPPLTDPGAAHAHPALANSNSINNYFEYGDDADGIIVPLASHIRKAYPRDHEPKNEFGTPKPTPEGSESRTQTHRLLRRGIPFGKSLDEPQGGKPGDARGLLFFAYQSDIERQFEFVQKHWVNDENFPEKDAGQDPIITNDSVAGEIKGCPFHVKANAAKCPVSFKHFVKTRGGQYFFSPSIPTLGDWLMTK